MIVLVVKRKPNGAIDKYKARLVALGNNQTTNSYDKIKAPTARNSSAKMIMSIQAKLNLKSCVIDIKGAFLKSTIKMHRNENLYVRLPDGRIGKLLKYLYGLKQAGKEWHENLSYTLLNDGYTQSAGDPCVFYKKVNKDYIMLTHVDDLFLCCSNK